LKNHIFRAQERVSKAEITEALLIAAFEGAGTQLSWKKEFSELLGEG
jgi:hypothetical protein